MQTLTEDFLTVPEAAAALHVAPSTIRRWIREGDLLAYRIGKRRVAIRRADLTKMVGPARTGHDESDNRSTPEPLVIRRLTTEEQRRGFEALARIERLQQKIMAARGGEPFSPSWKLINEARDERSRELA